MSDFLQLTDFLQPLSLSDLLPDAPLYDSQLGKHIMLYSEEFPDISDCDIVLIGIPEERGSGKTNTEHEGLASIRRQLYQLFCWHPTVCIADIGDITPGTTLQDTLAAVKAVVADLIGAGKRVVLLGGSHDLTLAQYGAYVKRNQIIEAACVDAFINLQTDTPLRSENFLMEMLTSEPNFVRHYNHIAFQSYFVNPRMLETMDKLRFDLYRLGVVKEKIEEMEPVIRNVHMMSIDMTAMAHAYAPSSKAMLNGLTGEEMCSLTRYAGMSPHLTSLGIYGYDAVADGQALTALQIAQMIWYYIDGFHRGKTESSLNDRHNFNEYHTTFTETDTVFLQSRKTGRWWMQLPDQRFIACSADDYMTASHNNIPERYLRALERD